MVLAKCLQQVEADVKLRSVSISHDADGVRGFMGAQRDVLQHLKGEHCAGSLERDVVLPKDARVPRSVDLSDVLEAKARIGSLLDLLLQSICYSCKAPQLQCKFGCCSRVCLKMHLRK